MPIWLVFDVNRKVEGVFDAAADATARAALALEWTATPQLADSYAKTQPGQFYGTNGKITNDPALTDLDAFKQLVKGTQGAFVVWFKALSDNAVAHDPADLAKGHRYLYRGLQGLYIISRNEMTERGRPRALTLAKRASAAANLPKGALDFTDVGTFYGKAHNVAAAPARPAVWLQLTDGATFGDRVNLADAQDVGGTEPAADVDLLAPDWVDAISS